jgi:hypothetical protein
MTNISKIDNNGNIQYLSSANIEITSAQKYEIDLKFQNISCADEGQYILVIIKELKMIATVSHFERNGGLNQILRRQTSRFHYG